MLNQFKSHLHFSSWTYDFFPYFKKISKYSLVLKKTQTGKCLNVTNNIHFFLFLLIIYLSFLVFFIREEIYFIINNLKGVYLEYKFINGIDI